MCTPVYIYTAADSGHASSESRLRDALARWCTVTGRPAVNCFSIIRPPFGKPRLENAPDIHFSITHSGDFWLCAIASQPVGLDLQRTENVQVQKLASRFFHPQEAAYLEQYPEDFFNIWAAKESYVKFTGLGIDDSFSSFSVVSNGALCTEIDGVRLRLLPFTPGYALCLCCPAPDDVRIETLN